ncbi:MAG: type II toxin-antitoxin system death-on-curing family toxin [Halothece sp.]
MKEPTWVSQQVVLAIHNDQLHQHGGRPGLRDETLLEASLARPRNFLAYESPDLFDLAAAYGYGLTKNHPFIDGNKRVAFMTMYVFLRLNGYVLNAPEPEVVIMMEQLSTNQKTQADLADWLRANS